MSMDLQKMNVTRAQMVNRAVVLNALRYRSGHSRASLARTTGLSTTAAANIVNELVEHGVVIETDQWQETVRGRKGKIVTLNPEYAVAIGMEVTDEVLRAVALDFAEQPLEARSRSLTSIDREGLLATMAAMIRELAETSTQPVHGVQIAMPGLVDPGQGVSLSFPGVRGWRPTPVAQILTERTGIPVRLDIRLLAGTTAEVRYGVGKDHRDFVYFNSAPGSGFGIGIVVNNEIIPGQNGLSGQFGHLHVDAQNRRCFCGSRGCLVTVAAPPAIVDQVNQAIDQGVETEVSEIEPLSFNDIVRAARRNDKLCVNTLELAGEYLGLGFSYVANILSPGTVVLSGMLAEAGDILVDAITRKMRHHTVGAVYDRVKFVNSILDENGVARGAASRLLDDFFQVSAAKG